MNNNIKITILWGMISSDSDFHPHTILQLQVLSNNDKKHFVNFSQKQINEII